MSDKAKRFLTRGKPYWVAYLQLLRCCFFNVQCARNIMKFCQDWFDVHFVESCFVVVRKIGWPLVDKLFILDTISWKLVPMVFRLQIQIRIGCQYHDCTILHHTYIFLQWLMKLLYLYFTDKSHSWERVKSSRIYKNFGL